HRAAAEQPVPEGVQVRRARPEAHQRQVAAAVPVGESLAEDRRAVQRLGDVPDQVAQSAEVDRLVLVRPATLFAWHTGSWLTMFSCLAGGSCCAASTAEPAGTIGWSM